MNLKSIKKRAFSHKIGAVLRKFTQNHTEISNFHLKFFKFFCGCLKYIVFLKKNLFPPLRDFRGEPGTASKIEIFIFSSNWFLIVTHLWNTNYFGHHLSFMHFLTLLAAIMSQTYCNEPTIGIALSDLLNF
jgi:hypothetical protein